jgi:hypothetical protein
MALVKDLAIANRPESVTSTSLTSVRTVMLIELFSKTFNYNNSLRIACNPSFMLSVPLTGKVSLRHIESF